MFLPSRLCSLEEIVKREQGVHSADVFRKRMLGMVETSATALVLVMSIDQNFVATAGS